MAPSQEGGWPRAHNQGDHDVEIQRAGPDVLQRLGQSAAADCRCNRNKQASEKSDLKRKLEELAAQSGFNVNELFGARTSSLKGSKVAVKFRNPKDDTQTWTGRGRKPNWLVEALGKGKKIDNFRVA